MQNDNQKGHPGEERHYGQNPMFPSQTPPMTNPPDLSVPNYPPPPPLPSYTVPPSSTTQDFGGGMPGGMPPGRPPERPKRPKTILILSIVIVVLLAATGLLAFAVFSKPATLGTVAGSTVTQVGQPTTSTDGTSTGGSTPSLTPTVQPSSTNNYSALEPGPGCDKNGGTWTPQGLANIDCGTRISLISANTRGYLFLQLPNNKAFSPNNKIGIIGSPASYQCIGLDEQDANTGFLGEYCGDGHWSIYTISSTDGSIVQTLDKNLTSTRSTVDISLAINGNKLSFSIDNEMHEVSLPSPMQPAKVAITDSVTCNCGSTMTVNNFSYTVLSS